MPVASKKEEKYTPEKLDRLKSMIARTGRDFSIVIDEMRVIPRSNDTSQFDCFEEYVDEDTEVVKVQLFHGTANTCDNYIFYIKPVIAKPEPVLAKPTPLYGLEMDQRLEEKLSIERQKWEGERLKDKLQQTEKDLKEAEEYIDLLHDEISEEKKKSDSGSGIWGELGTTVLTMVKNNPSVLSGIPLLSGLAGASPAAITPTSETEASFSKKSETSEEDEQYLQFLKSLQLSFSKQEFDEVIEILRKLAENPGHIAPVKELLD